MNKQQTVWAARHDWFHSVELTNPSRPLEYAVQVYSDGIGSELIAFSNYQELRDWAGY